MSLLRGLFGRRDKKRLDRAGMLVQAARINAVGMFVPLLDRFAVLRDTDVEHWDYIVTVAGVFTAATRLNNLHLRRSSTDELMQVVTERLQNWNPDGIRGFEDCKRFFESEFDRLTEAGHEPRFVASDAIGAWITWNVLGRAPQADEECRLLRAVGVAVTHTFFEWWNT